MSDEQSQQNPQEDNNTSTEFESTPEICKYYLSGTCKFGDQCRFSHDVDASVHGRATLDDNQIVKPRFPQVPLGFYGPPMFYPFGFPFPRWVYSPRLLRSKPCKFYHQGKCKFGMSCRFAHIINGNPEFETPINQDNESPSESTEESSESQVTKNIDDIDKELKNLELKDVVNNLKALKEVVPKLSVSEWKRIQKICDQEKDKLVKAHSFITHVSPCISTTEEKGVMIQIGVESKQYLKDVPQTIKGVKVLAFVHEKTYADQVKLHAQKTQPTQVVHATKEISQRINGELKNKGGSEQTTSNGKQSTNKNNEKKEQKKKKRRHKKVRHESTTVTVQPSTAVVS